MDPDGFWMPGCSWQLGRGPLAFLDWKKLHCLVGPTSLGVSTPTRRPRDTDVEARGQRLADAKAKGQRSEGKKIRRSKRSEGQRGPESKS